MRKPNFCFLKSVPFLACILGIGSSSLNWAMNMPISLFPLENHEQNIDAWIEVTDSEYRKPLLDPTYQKERLKEFYNHYFSTDEKSLSPWGKAYLDQQISRDPNLKFLKKTIKDLMKKMKDPKYIGYGENFRPYQKEWFEKIASNMDLEQLGQNLIFDPKQRGILIQNTFARVLPTSDAYFYSFELPGEGYPFDNLQESALWVGTPIYIIGQTQDKQWSLIVAPELTAWIPTAATARVNEQFIKTWQKCAHTKLAAISETNISITDLLNGDYLFKAYVGAVFPVVEERAGNLKILVPLRDFKGNARIRYSLLTKRQAALMPMIATPENFIRLIKTLQNRPYGWGGSYFYNDCSAELKSLYTPFGIWLPRHSTDQVSAGKMIDKSAEPVKARIEYLTQKGRPWITFVYVGQHVFLYLGNRSNTQSEKQNLVPLTYQNLWALRPLDQSRRAVIGQALIFPLLETYPEDPTLNSQANQPYFQVVYLDEWSDAKH